MAGKTGRTVKKLSGFAAFLAFLGQLFSVGPTLDFEPVDDVFQTEQTARVGYDAQKDKTSMSLVPYTADRQKTRLKKRYTERSRFDGRGGIFDAYS